MNISKFITLTATVLFAVCMFAIVGLIFTGRDADAITHTFAHSANDDTEIFLLSNYNYWDRAMARNALRLIKLYYCSQRLFNGNFYPNFKIIFNSSIIAYCKGINLHYMQKLYDVK